MNITDRLYSLQDIKYRDFQAKLIPGDVPERFIGVRTPELKKLARELIKDGSAEGFITALPHSFFDEDQLHAFIISELRVYEDALREVGRFLPYVNNWATCDQLSPKVFGRNTDRLIAEIRRWLTSDHTYTVRFALRMLMCHYLGEGFSREYTDLAASVHSEEYYINMMIAWYFATALAKQYDTAVTYLEERRLDPWVHNKTIQKARESFRVSDERKEYLKTLKI